VKNKQGNNSASKKTIRYLIIAGLTIANFVSFNAGYYIALSSSFSDKTIVISSSTSDLEVKASDTDYHEDAIISQSDSSNDKETAIVISTHLIPSHLPSIMSQVSLTQSRNT